MTAPTADSPGRSTAARRRAKLDGYERFLQDKLKPELQAALAARKRQEAEVQELRDLAIDIQLLQEQQLPSFKARVDLGAGVYCRAHVPDASHLFLALGLGFYVRCSLHEAQRLLALKLQAAQAKVKRCTDDVVRIRADMRLVEEGIRELLGLPAPSSEEVEEESQWGR